MRNSYFQQTGICGYEREKALKLIGKLLPGSIILFKSDFTDKDDLVSLIKEINKLYVVENSLNPPIISVDQEGGMVVQVPWLSFNPSNAFLGQLKNEKFCKLMGERTGYDLKNLGITWHLSPVLDIYDRYNPLIGERSFSSDIQEIARFGASFIAGEQSAGVASTGKHFPCKGPSPIDTHKDLPIDDRTFNEILNDSYPYFTAIAQGLKSIMMGHIIHSQIDDTLPFSLSKHGYDFLRKYFSFYGVVITDSLDMGAVSKKYSVKERGELASKAGADILENVELEQSIEMSEYIRRKDENASVERIRNLIPKNNLRYTPPSSLIDAFALTNNFLARAQYFLDPNCVTLIVFLDGKKENAVEENFSPEEDVKKFLKDNMPVKVISKEKAARNKANQIILIGKNEHSKDRKNVILQLTSGRKAFYLGTGMPTDIGFIPENIQYISLMSSRMESVIGGIYKSFGLY